MEVAGVVCRQSPCFSSVAADVANGRRLRCFPAVKRVGLVGVTKRDDWKSYAVFGEFSDKGHLRYYEGPKMAVKEKKDEKNKKEMKKKLKVLKGLSKNLNTFSEMGFGLSLDDDGLDQQVKGKMISEATDVLIGQLQKLKEEKMEAKRIKKEEKAKKKAARMTTKTDCKDSSSSSESSSSESDCDNVVNMSQLKTVPTNSTTHQETTSLSVQTLEKTENQVGETAMCKVSSNVNEAECGKKIEVCMGGKCKKSGAAMLLENFQAAVGGEAAAVVGCKCMGKCRDGPNVMVRSDDVAQAVTNSLCIGVGLEDVDTIVTNFFGGGRKSGSGMVPALS